MIGFAAAGALAGLAAIAWPVYLHLRRRRRRVQVVPSLHLFDDRVHRARARPDDLPLLVLRALALAALALLLARPFLRTRLALPLPDLDARQAERTLGLVVQDDLGALRPHGAATRLGAAQAWLAGQLAAQPADTAVLLATSTAPDPGRPMDPAAAAAALEPMEPVPLAGDLADALARVAGRLRAGRGLLVVAGTRDADLWRELDALRAAPPAAPVLFLDLSAPPGGGPGPAWVQSVERRGGEDQWSCRLAGPQEALAGRRLQRVTGGRLLDTWTISPFQAMNGAAVLRVPRDRETPAWSIELDAGNGHPWTRFYLAPRAGAGRGVAVLTESTPQGRTAAQVVAAALRAGRPTLPIHYLPEGRPDTDPLPDVSAVAVVGTPRLSPRETGWLAAAGRSGAPWLCVPTGSPGRAGPAAPGLPRWLPSGPSEGAVAVAVEAAGAPRIVPEGVVRGLGEVRFPLLVEPRFEAQALPVLAARDGRALLSVRLPPDRGPVWALGFALDLAEGGPAFHPALALLLNALLAGAPEADSARDGVFVGDWVRLADWFGEAPPGSVLRLPDGSSWQPPEAFPELTRCPVREPGFYALLTPSGPRFGAANVPRAPVEHLLAREDWEARLPGVATRWIDPGGVLADADYDWVARAAPGGAAPARPRRYDLSPLAALLLAGSLVLEGLRLCFR